MIRLGLLGVYLELEAYSFMPGFLHGCLRLNSEPHDCVVNTLPTSYLPQPCFAVLTSLPLCYKDFLLWSVYLEFIFVTFLLFLKNTITKATNKRKHLIEPVVSEDVESMVAKQKHGGKDI